VAEQTGSVPWILVDTKERTLSVLSDNLLLDRFENIAVGRGGVVKDKLRDDGATPQGIFHIDFINLDSPYLMFFRFDYPRAEHAQRAFDAGKIDLKQLRRILEAIEKNESPPQDTPLGGQLGIHGLGNGNAALHAESNWTQGCIALTNEQIERLAQWIFLGMKVEVW
jgi:murein L,D-transpeptidase YafK